MMHDSWDMEYNRQIFLSLWTIFCPFTPTEVYHKWQSYDIRFLRYQLQQTGFFCVLGPFFALLPLTAKKWKYKKELKTWKKCLEISSFHQVYQKSWSYALEIWHVMDVIVIVHFGPFFTPLTARKVNISKKWKKHLEISSFYRTVPKILIIGYTVPEIWHVTRIISIFHFELFFPLLSP